MLKTLAALALTAVSTLALAEATVFPLPTTTVTNAGRPAAAAASTGPQVLMQGEATVFVDRATSTLTRAQVRAETAAYFAMHRPHGEASHLHIDAAGRAAQGPTADRAMVMADAVSAARSRPIGEANRSDINQRAR